MNRVKIDFKEKRKIKMLAVSAIAAVILVLADQIIKLIVANNIEYGYESIKVIDNFFYLVNWRNTGGAWGMMSDYTWILTCVTLLASAFFVYLIICSRSKLVCTSFVLILSGAIGNVIDRVSLGYVVDYLHFNNLFGYDFPAFNLADICVVSGSIGLVISILFIRKISLFEKGTLVDRVFGENDKDESAKAETEKNDTACESCTDIGDECDSKGELKDE